jgi:hypothetical protein
MILEKYSFGIGDRFGHQGRAQLGAIIEAKKLGVDITPVWNKSNREHMAIHTAPLDTRKAADAAVNALGYSGPYRVDADHINLKNVDGFIESSDFFTLDVADFIGQKAAKNDIDRFVEKYKKYTDLLQIPHIADTFIITATMIETIAGKYLLAVKEAGKIYHHIESTKSKANFIAEVSMDETNVPQTPIEMFFILAAIADEGIPAQTIAPKFTGRFNKGVDYVGDVAQFAKEFEQDVAVIAFAIKEFGLPKNLKLSIHSGSDKFSVYGAINRTLRKFNAGVHVKTAGTTWLEEVIGLAMAGGEGLAVAKRIYREAMGLFDELCRPYATVIDIDKAKLPGPDAVDKWSGEDYASTLRHDQRCAMYNPHFRQLVHVGYKVAAQMGEAYLCALEKCEDIIAANVQYNLLERHIKPIFLS